MCVRDGSGMFVGQGGTRLATRRLVKLKLCEECQRTLGMGWKAAVEADTIGEQQLKWTQSRSSSHSGCKQRAADAIGAAAEADTIREHAAAEADAIGEQQLKQTQWGAAALHRELSGAGLLT